VSKTIYVLRRNSGQGGAEKAAERLASQLEQHFNVQRMWAGRHYQGDVIPGERGAPWWRSWRYTRFLDRLKLKGLGSVVLSLEYGPDCDIYRAGDGVHRLNVLRRYGEEKRWMFNPWHWYAPRLERKCLESAQVIVANSNLVKDLICSEYPYLGHKTKTIYNGFDPSVYCLPNKSKEELRRQLGLPEHGTQLLLSGHGFARKGLHHAVSVLSELVVRRKKSVHLVVAGKGDKDLVKRQVESSDLSDRVHFVGVVDGIEKYYQSADFMILPTRHDPFSNSCLEALACGCPVITSAQNGAAEVVGATNGHVMAGIYDVGEILGAADFIEGFESSGAEVRASVKHLTQTDELRAYVELMDQFLANK